LAPEQARGEEAGARADLYALGVVTYQLLSGRLPYEATSLTELALKQQREEPPTLDTLVAAVSPELADAVAIALALDPRERYGSAREMGRALSDASRGIAPERRASRVGETQATSLLERGRPPTAATRQQPSPGGTVTPRRPRPGPPRAAPAEPYRAARPRRSGGRRLLMAVVILLALAAGAIGAIIATAPSSTRVVLRNVVYSDVQRTASALKQLVSENTK
ncbi:MAG TPA: hypothetical protein VNZ05_10600, partial [Solirubrobacteraceae bacterium]|nr:hypothetical protein [Solirubrobacteraceae bacterium]